MKLKKKLIVREVAGEYILIPTGEAVTEYNGIFTVSPVAALIIEMMEKDAGRNEIIDNILETFEIDKQTAETDFDAFVSQLEALNLL